MFELAQVTIDLDDTWVQSHISTSRICYYKEAKAPSDYLESSQTFIWLKTNSEPYGFGRKFQDLNGNLGFGIQHCRIWIGARINCCWHPESPNQTLDKLHFSLNAGIEKIPNQNFQKLQKSKNVTYQTSKIQKSEFPKTQNLQK